MDLLQAMQERHSVRSYSSKPIEGDAKSTVRWHTMESLPVSETTL